MPDDLDENATEITRSLHTLFTRAFRPAKRRIAPVAAAIIVLAPLLVAASAVMLAIAELRDALTFDRQAIQAAAARTQVLNLASYEEIGVRGFADRHRLPLLEPYSWAAPRVSPALEKLAELTLDLGVPEGTPAVNQLARINADWRTTVAGPLIGGRLSERGRTQARDHGKVLFDAYRTIGLRLGDAIYRHVREHSRAFAVRFFRISLLFLASSLMCALGLVVATGHILRVDRERALVEATLRERERRYAQDRAWSASLQRAILPPRLPSVPGCRFDAVYEPGASDANVGGDWYDAVRLVDGRILISIGDVAGSGLEAAVVMGVVRQIMRGIAQVHANPTLMLDAADRALRLEYADVFVTAWVGVIDLVTRTLTYASAGHPAPLLVEPGGSVHELRDAALPLGLRQGYQGEAMRVPLVDGATLVLYTDGLTEATRDLFAGDALVREAAAALADAAWDEPATEIQRRVLAQRSSDDVAILVARIDVADSDAHIARLCFDVRDIEAARRARDIFVGVLADRAFPAIESLNAELVFGELIGNVVRHAGNASGVEIAIDCSGPQTVLHVLDRGPGFRHVSRLPSDPYSESGRGLFLIAAMTDEFTVTERLGGGSHARAVLIGRLSRPVVDGETLLASPAAPAREPVAT